MSRSKCRPLGSRPARFSSQISLRRPSPRRYDACKTPPRSLSKCILKKRWPPSSFLRAFISRSFFPFHAQKGCTDSLLLPRFFLRFFSIERFALFFYRDDFKVEVFPSLEMNYNKMIVYIKFQLIARDFHKNYYTFCNQSRVCETFENVSFNLSIV